MFGEDRILIDIENLLGLYSHTLGAYGIYGQPKPYEQTFQIILTSLLDFILLNVNLIYYQLFLDTKFSKIETQKSEILS